MIVALADALGEDLPELSGPPSSGSPHTSRLSLPLLGAPSLPLLGTPSVAEIPPTSAPAPSVPAPSPARRWAGAAILASAALALGAGVALVAGRDASPAAGPRPPSAASVEAARRCVRGP
jgi:hypothetical protein